MPPEIVTKGSEEDNGPKSPVGRISEKYGIPPEDVEALLGGKPVSASEPHPLTMGALMKGNLNKAKNAMNENERNSWSPVAVLGAILGIAGILSLIVLLVFITRWGHHGQQKIALRDTVVMQVPPPPMPPPQIDTAMTASPRQMEPQTLPEAEKKPVAASHKNVHKPYLSTSSSIEAEERLAELRAEGNRKAKIVRRTHGGITFFDVK